MLTLKKLRIYPGQSEKTTAMRADAYWAGKRIGEAENSGRGEPYALRIDSWAGFEDRAELEDAVVDWCEAELEKMGAAESLDVIGPVDLWLSRQVEREHQRRWEKRRTRQGRVTVFQLEKDIGTENYHEMREPYSEHLAGQLRTEHGQGIRIVNEELAR